jgi:hypothetical protein
VGKKGGQVRELMVIGLVIGGVRLWLRSFSGLTPTRRKEHNGNTNTWHHFLFLDLQSGSHWGTTQIVTLPLSVWVSSDSTK